MTALTQYFKTCHVPYILQNKHIIEEKAKKVIEQVLYPKFEQVIKAKVEEMNEADKGTPVSFEEEMKKLKYVVDFAFTYKIHENENDFMEGVTIVEFNPFGTSTSAGLFDWSDKVDEQVLRGNSPFQFRVIEKPFNSREEIRGKMSKDVQAILQNLRPHVKAIVEQEQPSKADVIVEQEKQHSKQGGNCIVM